MKKYVYSEPNGYSYGILYNQPEYFRQLYNEYLIIDIGMEYEPGYVGYVRIELLPTFGLLPPWLLYKAFRETISATL